MFKRARILAVAAVVVAGLGGCALVEPNTSEEPLTGVAACALGKTWQLDTTVLAAQVQAELAANGVGAEVTVDGTQSMQWDLDGAVVVDSNYTMTITSQPAADQTFVTTSVHSGKATGISYVNAEVAIPRDWDASGLTITNTGTVNDAPAEAIPYAIPVTDFDDKVGIELTCDGGTLTTHPRGGPITLTWTS